MTRFRFLLTRAIPFLVRYTKGYFAKERFIPRPVPRLSLETTNVCNSDCVFCANSLMQRRRQPMKMDDFKKAVDDFVAMGGTTLDFNVVIGEPLLDPLLLERAKYVKQFPQLGPLGFVTTLQWLHRFDMDEFFQYVDWLSISTTLSGREKYLEFFRVDKYDQMLQNLLMLIEENKKRSKKIAYFFTIKPTNEPVEAVLNHPDFKRINALVDHDLEQSVRQQGQVDDWLGAVRLPAYLHKRPLIPRRHRPCSLLYTGLMVYSNGNIGACSCRDYEATSSELILGNVRDDQLADVWKGEKLNQIRTGWRERNAVPDICKTCRHYVY